MNGKQRATDNQMRRQSTRDLQKIASFHFRFSLSALKQSLKKLRLMKVRTSGFWQECAPVAARRATPENRIEIPADLIRVAVPTERAQGNLQLRVPAAGRPKGR